MASGRSTGRSRTMRTSKPKHSVSRMDRMWERVMEATRLDTCFCYPYKVHGPKPGEETKTIGLLTSTTRSEYPRGLADILVQTGLERPKNKVRTYKYTIWDFLPRAIAIQFSRFVNSFYLCIMILASIGFYSQANLFFVSFDPIAILIVVVVVVGVTVIIEGINDLNRHMGDRKTNAKPVMRLNEHGEFVSVPSGSIHAGDILKVSNRESVPADVVVLTTECTTGLCYIETAEIDGETNLKIKEAPQAFNKEISQHLETPCGECKQKQCGLFVKKISKGLFEYEEPTPLLKFTGRFIPEDDDKETIPLAFNNLVLRGSVLRNTKWIIAVVVYSGPETKLVMSKSDTPQKFGLLDAYVNVMMCVVFGVYVLCCIAFALVIDFGTPNTNTLWYFQNSTSTTNFKLPVFWAFLFTYATFLAQLIPITLYLCVEVAAFAQQYLITTDLDMYHEKTDTRAGCRSPGLVAEIGQVTHVFSDKTGTLTNNQMILVGFYASGSIYGFKPQGETTEAAHPSRIPPRELFSDVLDVLDQSEDKKYNAVYMRAVKKQRKEIMDFLFLIAVCHSVVIDQGDDGSFSYNAESPDEEALVILAAELGFSLISTSNGIITIQDKHNDTKVEFTVLALNPFDSARKCMSIVVKRKAGDVEEVVMLIKGADNVMFGKLKEGQEAEKAKMEDTLNQYSWMGLRTLVMGERIIPLPEFLEWQEEYQQATQLPGDLRGQALSQVAAKLERDVSLVGASAIEDELQEGVPETIQSLRDAGIRIWVATGDKVETATNIALSAKLIDSSMFQIKLTSEDPAKLWNQLDSASALISDAIRLKRNLVELKAETRSPEALEAQQHKYSRRIPRGYMADVLSLTITGASLGLLLQEEHGTEQLESLFLEVAGACKVILACRVSPKQKALLVEMIGKASVWDSTSPVTLAIGDGANDVPMIQAARIGVGISGNEGMQAASSADFSFAQFRYLKKLLLVHGHWNYRRNAALITYVTYSQIVFALVLAFYLSVSMYSGQQITVNVLYLVAYGYLANIPIIFSCIFNKDVSAEKLMENPWTYAFGRRREDLNVTRSVQMILRAFAHAIIIWIGTVLVFTLYRDFNAKEDTDLVTLGATVYTCVMFVMYRQMLVLTKTFTYINTCILALGMSLFLVLMVVVDDPTIVYDPEVAPLLWLEVLWVVGAVTLVETCLNVIYLSYLYTPLTVLSEMSGIETSYEIKHILKQAGEALTLPIKIPADSIGDALRKLEQKTPTKVRFLPTKVRRQFDFDFAVIGNFLPFGGNRKKSQPQNSGDLDETSSLTSDSSDSRRKMFRQHSSMHSDAYRRFNWHKFPFQIPQLPLLHHHAKPASPKEVKETEKDESDSPIESTTDVVKE